MMKKGVLSCLLYKIDEVKTDLSLPPVEEDKKENRKKTIKDSCRC